MMALKKRKNRKKNPSVLGVVGITLGVTALAAVAAGGVIMYRLMQK